MSFQKVKDFISQAAASFTNGDYGFGSTPQYDDGEKGDGKKGESQYPKILLMGLRR